MLFKNSGQSGDFGKLYLHVCMLTEKNGDLGSWWQIVRQKLLLG